MVEQSRVALLEAFLRNAVEVGEKELPTVSESTSIAALGFDSLNMLEIIGALEREFRIRIPDESLGRVQTVHDLLDIVQACGPV